MEVSNIIHYGLHLLLPVVFAALFYRHKFKMAFVIMLFAMLIDIDHLLANPVFDAHRCSVGFHLLHTYWAIGIYITLLFFKQTRIWGLGALLHILTDTVDCIMMHNTASAFCISCFPWSFFK
jgi:hypothetical protein